MSGHRAVAGRARLAARQRRSTLLRNDGWEPGFSRIARPLAAQLLLGVGLSGLLLRSMLAEALWTSETPTAHDPIWAALPDLEPLSGQRLEVALALLGEESSHRLARDLGLPQLEVDQVINEIRLLEWGCDSPEALCDLFSDPETRREMDERRLALEVTLPKPLAALFERIVQQEGISVDALEEEPLLRAQLGKLCLALMGA